MLPVYDKIDIMQIYNEHRHVVYGEMYPRQFNVLRGRSQSAMIHDIRDPTFPRITQYTHCAFVLYHTLILNKRKSP